MSKKVKVRCVICPVGCIAEVEVEGPEVRVIGGLECRKGLEYVVREVKNPVRDLFTTVRVRGGRLPVCPVRATAPVPKDLLMECVKRLARVVVKAPIEAGEVIVRDLMGLGVDIIATRTIEKTRDTGPSDASNRQHHSRV